MAIKPILSIRGEYSSLAATGFLSGGVYDGFPFQWNVTFSITAQPHGDNTTPSAFEYNALDVAVGDWIINDVGESVQIIAIDTLSTTNLSLVCTVEDIDLFNINSNLSASGEGFTSSGKIVIFKENDAEQLIINPIDSFNISQQFFINAISRFQYTASAKPTGITETSAVTLIENYGYITEASAVALIAAISASDVSALSQLTDDIGVVTIDTATSVLSQLVNDAGYITETSAVALIAALSAFDVSALSQLTNDVGYITEASAAALLTGIEGDRILGYNGDNFVIASASSNAISIGTGGQTVMTITASGNVGIGIENPTAKLEIFELSAESSFVQFATLITGQAITDGAMIGIIDTSVDLTVQNNEAGKIKLNTNGIEAVVVDAIGNVGVGTSAPTEKFEVIGTAKFTQVVIKGETTYKLPVSGGLPGQLLTTDGGGNSYWETNTGGGFTETSAVTLIESYGYITEISAVALIAALSASDVSALSQLTNDAGYITETSAQLLINAIENDRILGFGGDAFVIVSATSNSVKMGTSNQTVITITASGNVGIGTETPTSRLEIFDSSAESAFIQFATQLTGPGNSDGMVVGIIDNSLNLTIQNNEVGQIIFVTNGTKSLVVDINGRVGVATSSPSQTFTVNGTAKFTQVIISGASTTYKLPVSGGISGQVLTTDGSGATYWEQTDYRFRINTGAADAIDIGNPVSALPTGWGLLSATATTVSLSHNVGRRPRQITFHGFTSAVGYRFFGGSTTVFGFTPVGFDTTQIRINIDTVANVLSENNSHIIMELTF